MVMSRAPRIFSWVLKASFTGALCVLLSWRISHDHREVKLRVLNYMLSALSFADLPALEARGNVPDGPLLRGYERYFTYVAANVPGSADAYAMLGFCKAKMGRTREALASYGKAAAIDPYLAGVYYNMGALYLRAGDPAKARENFRKAVDVPVEANVEFLRHSKIYLDILRQADMDFGRRLKETYALSGYLADACAAVNKDNAPPLRIF